MLLQSELSQVSPLSFVQEYKRADGSLLRFDRNSCVIVNQKLQPIGTRVLGFVTHELRARQMTKVLALAARVL